MGKELGTHREALPLRFLVIFYRYGCANMLRIGDKININSHEGFGGPGVIVDTRSVDDGKYKVRMTTQPKDFWAWDFEIDELSDQNLVRNKRGVYYLIRSLFRGNK